VLSPGTVLVAMWLGVPTRQRQYICSSMYYPTGHSCNVHADSCSVLMQTERLAGYFAVGEGHCHTGYLPNERSYKGDWQ